MAVDIETGLVNQDRSHISWKLGRSCFPSLAGQQGSVAERSKALV
jgi:hypothetical protein